MNKTEFLRTLKKLLKCLKKTEIQKNISYYEEILSDMIENGQTEQGSLSSSAA